jgi:hypothetical protein
MNKQETINYLNSLIRYIQSLSEEQFTLRNKYLNIDKIDFNIENSPITSIEYDDSYILPLVKSWCIQLTEENKNRISESRVPYTYHHDFIRRYIGMPEFISRSTVASKWKKDEDEYELWFLCLYYILVIELKVIDTISMNNDVNFLSWLSYMKTEYLSKDKLEELRKKYYF